MKAISELLEAGGGILLRRSNRSIVHQIDYCLRTGSLRAVLPGIYAAAEPSWEVRVLAAEKFRPGCVITGAAAARMLWWPKCPMTVVSAAVKHTVAVPHGGFHWEKRVIPDELTIYRGDLRIASPAMSILDLLPTLGGQAIDEGLRRRAIDLPTLRRALELTPNRQDNGLRRTLIADSRDQPWSEAEREAHRLLRAAGIAGWCTNQSINAGEHEYTVDIAFLEQRVVIEIDGWKYHKGRDSFTNDRWRYSRMAAAGWTVLPLSATAIEDDPQAFIDVVAAALHGR